MKRLIVRSGFPQSSNPKVRARAFSKCDLRPSRTAASQIWSGWQCLACLHRAQAATRDEWLGPDTARCFGGFQLALHGTADFTKRFPAGVDREAPEMKVPFTLGEVGHFGLAVRDPKKSAKWFGRALGLRKEFEFDSGVAVGNDFVTIALFKGKPSPETIDHISFHVPDMATLRKALAHLKKIGVDIEDPGHEIGPEAPGSKNMGLWFHDPDGYRWELSVLGGR